jgi:hypothetical protein
MWCKSPQFWDFLSETHAAPPYPVKSEEQAVACIKSVCAVDSRRELDTDNEANKAWHRLIREPYRVWLIENP